MMCRALDPRAGPRPGPGPAAIEGLPLGAHSRQRFCDGAMEGRQLVAYFFLHPAAFECWWLDPLSPR